MLRGVGGTETGTTPSVDLFFGPSLEPVQSGFTTLSGFKTIHLNGLVKLENYPNLCLTQPVNSPQPSKLHTKTKKIREHSPHWFPPVTHK